MHFSPQGSGAKNSELYHESSVRVSIQLYVVETYGFMGTGSV